MNDTTQVRVREEVELLLLKLEEEMDGPRGRLYEKYGSAATDFMSPLWEICDRTKRDNPWLAKNLLEAVFK